MKKEEDFDRDLSLGELGEKIIMIYLFCNGYKNLKITEGYFKEYDISGTSPKTNSEVFYEVKTDDYCTENSDTGNMAIEIEYKKKPSGITCTKADVFVYYYYHLSVDNLWMIKVDDLKKLIKDNYKKYNFKIVQGGDNNDSKLILLPRKYFKKYFYIDTINKTKTDG